MVAAIPDDRARVAALPGGNVMVTAYPGDENLEWTVTFTFDPSKSYPYIRATRVVDDVELALELERDKDNLFTMPVLAPGDKVRFVCATGAVTLMFENGILFGNERVKGEQTYIVNPEGNMPKIFKAICVVVDNATHEPTVWGTYIHVPR